MIFASASATMTKRQYEWDHSNMAVGADKPIVNVAVRAFILFWNADFIVIAMQL